MGGKSILRFSFCYTYPDLGNDTSKFQYLSRLFKTVETLIPVLKHLENTLSSVGVLCTDAQDWSSLCQTFFNFQDYFHITQL